MRLDARSMNNQWDWVVIDARTGQKVNDVCWADDVSHELGIWKHHGQIGPVVERAPRVVFDYERKTVLCHMQDDLNETAERRDARRLVSVAQCLLAALPILALAGAVGCILTMPLPATRLRHAQTEGGRKIVLCTAPRSFNDEVALIGCGHEAFHFHEVIDHK